MGDWDKPCQPAATGGFYSGFFTESDTTTENVSPNSALLIKKCGLDCMNDIFNPTPLAYCLPCHSQRHESDRLLLLSERRGLWQPLQVGNGWYYQ